MLQLVFVWLHAYEIAFYVAVNDSLSLMKCFTYRAPFSHSCSAKGPKCRHLAGARSKTEIIRVLLPKWLFGVPLLLRPLRATHGCVYCTTTYICLVNVVVYLCTEITWFSTDIELVFYAWCWYTCVLWCVYVDSLAVCCHNGTFIHSNNDDLH